MESFSEIQDVTDLLEIEDMTSSSDEFYKLFNEFDEDELIESITDIIDSMVRENPLIISNPLYEDIIENSVMDILEVQFEEYFQGTYGAEYIERFTELIQESIQTVFKHLCPKRSFNTTFIRKEPNYEKLSKKIEYLKNKPQPEQRTHEWYSFRHNVLTASNIWKVFSSESNRNQLIYDKCKQFNIDKYNNTSTEGPLHWGQKYEPLSVMLYEELYETKVDDFGCILHDKYEFLAASPDGINTSHESKRFGRMLEIKNIVNREITGIPKEEYWIQMQVQMEVCNLNECDFLETRFVEYNSYDDFISDGTYTESSDGKLKGVIMHFVKEDKPFYKYIPIHTDEEESELIQENIMEELNDCIWVKNIYWKLDEYSCVLVMRNKLWFNKAIEVIKPFWNTIQNEKKTGFEHRAPKKREKRQTQANEGNLIGKCFIDIKLLDNDIYPEYNNSEEFKNKIIEINKIIDNVNVERESDIKIIDIK
jgi:putative phage-type endonuclease